MKRKPLPLRDDGRPRSRRQPHLSDALRLAQPAEHNLRPAALRIAVTLRQRSADEKGQHNQADCGKADERPPERPARGLTDKQVALQGADPLSGGGRRHDSACGRAAAY